MSSSVARLDVSASMCSHLLAGERLRGDEKEKAQRIRQPGWQPTRYI